MLKGVFGATTKTYLAGILWPDNDQLSDCGLGAGLISPIWRKIKRRRRKKRLVLTHRVFPDLARAGDTVLAVLFAERLQPAVFAHATDNRVASLSVERLTVALGGAVCSPVVLIAHCKLNQRKLNKEKTVVPWLAVPHIYLQQGSPSFSSYLRLHSQSRSCD